MRDGLTGIGTGCSGAQNAAIIHPVRKARYREHSRGRNESCEVFFFEASRI